MSDELEKKVAELEIIAKNASSKDDKDLLVSIMRTLVALVPELEAVKTEQAELKEELESLREKNKGLNDKIKEKDYQILHLKTGLKSYMDKEEIK